MNQHTKPCKTCPFRKTIKPGALGGSPVATYIGQVLSGVHWLPCHEHSNFSDPNWKGDLSRPQCAGAAIMRWKENVPAYPRILSIRRDDPTAFKDLNAFVAHHLGQAGIIIGKAVRFLLIHQEMDIAKKKGLIHAIPKNEGAV